MMKCAGATKWPWCAWIVAAALLSAIPVVGLRANAANGSLVIAAVRVLEQEYVDPVDPVHLLNSAIAVLRYGTHLGTNALPDIPPRTPRGQAVAQFTGAFSRAVGTGVVSETDLAYAATAGMLASLRDSHTYFLDPASLREGRKRLSGNPSFSGIGVLILSRRDAVGVRWIFVDRVLQGSPAMRAGLRRFDKIVEAGGKSLRNADALEASEILRGAPGSMASLVIEREGKELRVSIARAPVSVPPVEARFLRPGIAYLGVFEFSRGAGSSARNALATLAAQEPISSVVLDLRGNPGGLIVEAASFAGIFVPAQTNVARVIERGAPPNLLMTSGTPLLPRVPVVVLVNGGSASGAEIVAGAFKDHQRAIILGEKTAGALGGSIIVPLPEGGMSVTVDRILLPKSGQVEGVGVSPNVAVELTTAAMERGEDSQLQAAVRTLEGLQKAKKVAGISPASLTTYCRRRGSSPSYFSASSAKPPASRTPIPCSDIPHNT